LIALAGVLSNLYGASASLRGAQNQSVCVNTTVSGIGAAVGSVREVIRFIDVNGVNNTAAVRLANTNPDFTPPPKKFSNSNTNLYSALESLRVAFEKLGQAPGGDWGGLRANLNQSIASAAGTLRPCIVEGNKAFEERRGTGRGEPQRSTATPETKPSIESALSSLERAATALRRAQNQSECVKTTVSRIDVAVGSVKDVIRFVDADGASGPSPGKAGNGPDFTPPPRKSPNSNTNLYNALDSLRNAFEKLGQASGGDWGGLRMKVNNDIAAAVGILNPCIVEGNKIFEERRGRE
jgi:hypothetical protein